MSVRLSKSSTPGTSVDFGVGRLSGYDNQHIHDGSRSKRRLTKDEGKEEKVVFDAPATGGADGAGNGGGLRLRLASGVTPSCPCRLSQPINSGSLPSAQTTSTPARPRGARPEAHTAAKAAPIWANGTRAVAVFGGCEPRG